MERLGAKQVLSLWTVRAKKKFRKKQTSLQSSSSTLIWEQQLFSQAKQERDYRDRMEFINNSPFFCNWTERLKSLLQMSLRKETYTFDTPIFKQGQPVRGLYFMLRGSARIVMDPTRHKLQYPKLLPFKDDDDYWPEELEFMRPKKHKGKSEEEAVEELWDPHIRVRRQEGYVAAEKMRQERAVTMCYIRSGEILGDVEAVFDLDNYMQTVVCTSNCELMLLDVKNYERLIPKKNQATVELLRKHAEDKVRSRANSGKGSQIPVLRHLVYVMDEAKPVIKSELPPLPPIDVSAVGKKLPEKEQQQDYLLSKFMSGEAPLIDPFVPGAVLYKEKIKKKAEVRAKVRKEELKRIRQKRGINSAQRRRKRARSMAELKEALKNFEKEQEVEKRKRNKLNTLAQQHNYPYTDQKRAASNTELERKTGDAKWDGLFNEKKKPKPKLKPEKDEPAMGSREPSFITETAMRESYLPPVTEEEKPSVNVVRKPVEVEVNDPRNNTSEERRKKLKLTFINAMVKRKMEKMTNEQAYTDWETSDKTLSFLEDRVKNFSVNEVTKKEPEPIKLPKLKRFKVLDEDIELPKMGGKVWIRQRPCRAAQTDYEIKNHEHVRYHMVPKLPDFVGKEIQRKKFLSHLFMDLAVKKKTPESAAAVASSAPAPPQDISAEPAAASAQ